MAIKAFDDCTCAGFNPSCYGLFVETGTLNPNEYLLFPIGQGVETLPALINNGDMTVGGNIVMTGTEGVNYIEFPDDTQQFTAYVQAGQLISTLPITALSTSTQNDYFAQVNIVSFPNNASTYNLNAFSGGGQTSTVATNPTSPVTGQPYTNTVYGTSPSGIGISFTGVPVVKGQSGGATYAVQIVSQPNLRNPFLNPDGVDRYSGSFSLNVVNKTMTIISTDSTSNVNSIIQGTPFVVNNPPFGCPTSFIVRSILTAGSVYGISAGFGSNNPAYYTNQATLTGFGLRSSSISASFNASLSGGVMTISGAITGTLLGSIGHWIYFPSSDVVYFKPYTGVNNQTTYTMIGNTSNTSITIQQAYAYGCFCGTDTYISTWQGSSWQRNAILRGAVPVNSVAGGSGGSITLQQDVGRLTTQAIATIGSPGIQQSTQTYPDGLSNFGNTVVSNSLARTSSVLAIQSCADSGSWRMLFPPTNTYTSSTLSTAGFGGVEVKFYA
jgi:hypothetical protein